MEKIKANVGDLIVSQSGSFYIVLKVEYRKHGKIKLPVFDLLHLNPDKKFVNVKEYYPSSELFETDEIYHVGNKE